MDKEESEFRAALAEARRDFESGRPRDAIDRVIGTPGIFRCGKDPERFHLLQEMYAGLESSLFATVWHRVWHLNWDIDETLGHAGYGWLSQAGAEGSKIMDEWKSRPRNQE